MTNTGPKGPDHYGANNDIIRATVHMIGMIQGDQIQYFP